MSLNRRSFLRALVGVPFAAKAIESIIARGIGAPALLSELAPFKSLVCADRPVMVGCLVALDRGGFIVPCDEGCSKMICRVVSVDENNKPYASYQYSALVLPVEQQ